MERVMADRAQSAEGHREIAEAVGCLEREIILAVLSGRFDGSEGDFSARVRCPKTPKPTLNRFTVAAPLDSAE